MGLVVCVASALFALQDSDVPTVQLPPQAVEAPKPAADAPRLVVPEPAPARRIAEPAGAEGPSFAGFLVASVGVVALLGVAVWLLRKYGKGSRFLAGGPLKIVGRRALGARQELLLVEVGRRVLVLGSGKEGLTRLAEIADPDEVALLKAEREDGARGAFKETLREGLKAAAPAPAEDARGVYASIADELAEIKKTVHAWKA